MLDLVRFKQRLLRSPLTSGLLAGLPSNSEGEQALRKLANLASKTSNENDINHVFTLCSPRALNYLIQRAKMKLLVYNMRNKRKIELLNLLIEQRVQELYLASRMVLLDVIQSLNLLTLPDTRAYAETWVHAIFLGLRGTELTQFKRFVDTKGTAENMHKLLYDDITSETLRGKLIQHFAREGQKIIETQGRTCRKILCDIDDTLFSSGGSYPAGIDTTAPRGGIYPGVLEFLSSLDDTGGGNVVFVSSRPHLYKDYVEMETYTYFTKLLEQGKLKCTPSLLTGDLSAGAAYVLQGDFQPMALKKKLNFDQYFSIYPECKYILVCDNGQSDVSMAELVVSKHGTDVVERVYVHQVQPISATFGYNKETSEATWSKLGVVFFHTYIYASLDAAKQGFISLKSLKYVIESVSTTSKLTNQLRADLRQAQTFAND